MKIKNLTFALMLSGLASMPAHAGFELVDVEEPVAETVAAPQPVAAKPAAVKQVAAKQEVKTEVKAGHTAGLISVGRQPDLIPEAKGFGTEVTLKDALTQLVPNNFNVYNDGNARLGSSVSWKANGRNWVQALEAVAQATGTEITLNWNDRTISLAAATTGTVNVNAAVGNVIGKNAWTISTKDRTIRSAVQRWATDAGWNVDWAVPKDFPIEFDTTFSGDFETAVSGVLEALSGTDYPIQACAYQNNTLRIVRFGDASLCQITK